MVVWTASHWKPTEGGEGSPGAVGLCGLVTNSYGVRISAWQVVLPLIPIETLPVAKPKGKSNISPKKWCIGRKQARTHRLLAPLITGRGLASGIQ